MAEQSTLQGKIKITATLTLETGLHIGAASDFSPIGAIDSPFIRDPMTKKPIIPGSSLKGKMRTLLAKSYSDSYILNDIDNDDEKIKRLFGNGANKTDRSAHSARLQFWDLKMNEESFQKFSKMDLDTYIGEVKFENTINRLTAEANPRQIERVPAGVVFDFQLVYNVENPDEIEEDMKIFSDGLKLLQADYIGGSGTRGYGRISFSKFDAKIIKLNHQKDLTITEDEISDILNQGN